MFAKWKTVERKTLHQSGKQYISRRNKIVPEKKMKTTKDCIANCKYQCNIKIIDEERRRIFGEYYKVDNNRRYDFIAHNTESIFNPKKKRRYIK